MTTIAVQSTEAIQKVKSKIEDKIGMHPGFQRLIFSGIQLDDRRTLSCYNIQHSAKIYLKTKLFLNVQREFDDEGLQSCLSEPQRRSQKAPHTTLQDYSNFSTLSRWTGRQKVLYYCTKHILFIRQIHSTKKEN